MRAQEKDTKTYQVASTNLTLNGEQRQFWFYDTQLGRAVLQEVLSGKSYPRLPYIEDVKTVLDVGANIGAATLYFAANYPQSRILAFEPDPQSYELLCRNVQGMPRISVFQFGLADVDKTAPLYRGLADPVTNSLGASPDAATHSDLQVSLRAADAVLAEEKLMAIDILKLDTEGAELAILRCLAPSLPNVTVIHVEFHSEADRKEIDRLLGTTHSLVWASMGQPHRGELSYVLRGRVPAQLNAQAITPR
ncbi:MAG TPA: FkbM family methyltransferase [Pirellulales bacterium]|jgi:FkbM family methyltransferase|nr:FkbM family methyltransferase [Pirellulales bacterium]